MFIDDVDEYGPSSLRNSGGVSEKQPLREKARVKLYR